MTKRTSPNCSNGARARADATRDDGTTVTTREEVPPVDGTDTTVEPPEDGSTAIVAGTDAEVDGVAARVVTRVVVLPAAFVVALVVALVVGRVVVFFDLVVTRARVVVRVAAFDTPEHEASNPDTSSPTDTTANETRRGERKRPGAERTNIESSFHPTGSKLDDLPRRRPADRSPVGGGLPAGRTAVQPGEELFGVLRNGAACSSYARRAGSSEQRVLQFF